MPRTPHRATSETKLSGVEAVNAGRTAIVKTIRRARADGLTDGQLADEILRLVADPTWAEDPALAKAMSHPVRANILRLLRDRGPQSPVRASEVLEDASLGTLAYHFRTLEKLGLVEVAHTHQRRGAIEHVYALTEA